MIMIMITTITMAITMGTTTVTPTPMRGLNPSIATAPNAAISIEGFPCLTIF